MSAGSGADGGDATGAAGRSDAAGATAGVTDADDRSAGGRRLWRAYRSNALAVAGGAVVAVVALVGLFAFVDDVFFDAALIEAVYYSPTAPRFAPLAPPSAAHPFGTDTLGRDVLARVIFGAKVAMQVSVTAVLVAAVVGSLMGVFAGYAGGYAETLLMRLVDVMLGFPALVLAIGVVAALGFSLENVIIALGIVYVPQFARIGRSAALSVVQEEYVDAARAMGYPRRHVLLREVLPNCLSPLLVQASLLMAFAIIAEAALSFLGLGVQPPTPSWGGMVSTGSGYLTTAPWISVFPGTAIFVTVLGFNLIGDGLRDALDPHERGERRF